MNGKILKIVNNDLYGNVDEREVVVFASFLQKKYMNRYIIFTFKGEYDKNKLYYGSIHLKNNSLVVFNIRQQEVNFVNEFITMYLNGKLNEEYEIIDINSISKIELVSYNVMDFDKLSLLDELSISKKNKNNMVESDNEKKPIFLYILLFVLILITLGITYLYFNPDSFKVEYKKLNCTLTEQIDELNLPYVINREVLFDNKDKVKSVNVTEVYTFLESEAYYDFKENNRQYEYFSNNGSYKYDDNSLSLIIMYSDKSIVLDYNEMLGYLKNEGYNCIEGMYDE